MNNRAQGTIEYLVIIAIVVVIALVVVGLLLQILGNFGTMSETSLKTSWKTAEPWAITDWSRSAGAATTGAVTVILKNNSSDTLNLRDFNLSSTGAGDRNNTAASTFRNVAPGATVKVDFNGIGTCSGKYTYPKAGIVIDYNNGTIAKKQYAVADIAGTC